MRGFSIVSSKFYYLSIIIQNPKVLNSTVVKGDLKASFSIVTASRCREGRNSFPWIAPLTHDPYLIMLSVKEWGIKYHFLSLWYDSTWGWTLSPRPLANTLPIVYTNLVKEHETFFFMIVFFFP